ncbi:hypothetical protein HKD37_18G049590 [Glycine soja]
MNHFFRKVPGRGFPGVFRKTFGYFRKNTSSGNFPENVLPELPEEPLTGLLKDFGVSLFRHFFRRTLVFSPLVFYPKVTILSDAHYKQRVRGRGTNLFAEKKKKALARLAKKKLHAEEKKKLFRERRRSCFGREEAVRNSVFRKLHSRFL